MGVAWGQIAPVAVSILIIIAIAGLRAASKTLAAITATMPLNIMLALWIISAAENGEKEAMIRFTESMLVGVGATLVCVAGMWLAARVGWELVPMIVVGYLAWGGFLVVTFVVGKVLGAG
jgi:hypothetical protein